MPRDINESNYLANIINKANQNKSPQPIYFS